MQDKTIKCRDCGKDFIWNISEQEFYQQRGFDNAPVRCVDCRKARRAGGANPAQSGPRQMHDITCASCGKADQVPFAPRDASTILCAECFDKKRQADSGAAA